MTTADWALVISLASLCVAISSFVWNIWSKFIYPRPKLKISFSIIRAAGGGDQFDGMEAVGLSITNLGPNSVVLQQTVAKPRKRLFRRNPWPRAILFPYPNWPYSTDRSGPDWTGGLPRRLEVGDTHHLHFPLAKDWFDDDFELVRFGVSDSFGREHFCDRKSVQKVRAAIEERGIRLTPEEESQDS